LAIALADKPPVAPDLGLLLFAPNPLIHNLLPQYRQIAIRA
jgi:hypothetical protein